MTLIPRELENIFIPDRRKVCQTCHKIRIKPIISKYDFNKNHRENICFCENNQEQQQDDFQQNQLDQHNYQQQEQQNHEKNVLPLIGENEE